MKKWFSPNGVPPRRKRELLYSHMLHLQAKTESDAILPTAEPAFTQKSEAKINSEVHDQRSKWRHVLITYVTLDNLSQRHCTATCRDRNLPGGMVGGSHLTTKQLQSLERCQSTLACSVYISPVDMFKLVMRELNGAVSEEETLSSLKFH